MARFTFALAGVSALALAALPAVAQAQVMSPIHGTVSGQYSNLSDGGSDANAWFGDLGVVYNGGMGIGGQANLGFGTADDGGLDADVWGIGGALTFRAEGFKFGGGVQYQSLDLGGGDTNVTSYGVAAEGYVNEMITFAGRGGGFSGTGGFDGFYLGGGAAIYPIPNLAVKGDIDYIDIDAGSDLTSYGAGFEFLPFSMVPVSLTGGYRNLDAGGFFGGDIDIWHVGLKAYLGTPGNGTLVDNHRNGAMNMGNVLGRLLGQ